MMTSKIYTLTAYVNIALKMFLCCPALNCSCERFFITLKIVKTYLKYRMTDDRFNNLAKLHKKSGITIKIQYIIKLYKISVTENQGINFNIVIYI